MNPLGLAEVLLHGEEERLVRGELGQLALRRLVELVVRRDLGEEVRQPAGLLQRRHPEEDPAGVVVLRDRLEGFDVVEPEPVHRLFNDRTYSADTARPGAAARPRPRPGFRHRTLSYIRDEVGSFARDA